MAKDEHICPTEIDRSAIRKSRIKAAKLSKRLVRDRFNEVFQNRPPGSRPADQVVSHAVNLYDKGPIERRKLRAAAAHLEATIRRDLSDCVILRAPRSVSSKPSKVGLMVYETRAVTEENQQFITAENHSIVLTEDRIVFISGLLPGGSRPHLFERVFERSGRIRTLAEIQLKLSAIWPTLLWMRTEQRNQGRGSPLQVMMTPFDDGLLFGSLQKVQVGPATGPLVVIVTTQGQETRTLHDYYGDLEGNRLWASTNTFVDGSLLSPDQLKLRNMLRSYVSNYADVIADNDWRWRFGFGANDAAVTIVADMFHVTSLSQARRKSALADLEAIAMSDTWQTVAARSLANQVQRQVRLKN